MATRLLSTTLVLLLLLAPDAKCFLVSEKTRRIHLPVAVTCQSDSVLLSVASSQGAQERRKAESLERGNHPLLSLNLNLDSLAQGGAAQRAQELLERIEALYREGYYAVSPDVVSYNAVLKAWVKRNSPEKALELLQSMEDSRDPFDSNSIQANRISYNTVIHAFAQNGLYREAEQLLREMQQHPNEGMAPDTVSFNSVLYAYAQSKDLDAPSKAEALLREMMTKDNQAQVDTQSFNVVLHAWANSNEEKAPFRAQELLEHMETLWSSGNIKVRPDVYSYTTVIQAWVSQLRNRRRRQENRSRGNHFDKLTHKLAQNNRTAAAQAAHKLLKKMEQQQLLPNQVTYTSVMAALCWSGKPDEAHDLLLRLLKRFEQQQAMVGESSSASSMLIKPDTIAFSAVMDGWVKNSNTFPEASDRVLELLKEMKDWQKKGHDDMAPNSRTYTSVISALAKSRTWDACLQARKMLLNEIPGGPTVIHYNAVLDAIAKSPRADKARLAKALLEEMVGNDKGPSPVSPDLISYNTVLSACAGSFGNSDLRKESLTVATAIFKHVCESDALDPSPYTFSVMIKAMRKLVGDEDARYDYVRKIFQLCCKKGSLNAGVWQQVKKSIPQDDSTERLWQNLLGSVAYRKNLLVADLPMEWQSNAKRLY